MAFAVYLKQQRAIARKASKERAIEYSYLRRSIKVRTVNRYELLKKLIKSIIRKTKLFVLNRIYVTKKLIRYVINKTKYIIVKTIEILSIGFTYPFIAFAAYLKQQRAIAEKVSKERALKYSYLRRSIKVRIINRYHILITLVTRTFSTIKSLIINTVKYILFIIVSPFILTYKFIASIVNKLINLLKTIKEVYKLKLRDHKASKIKSIKSTKT